MYITNKQENVPNSKFRPALGKVLMLTSLLLVLVSMGLGAYFVLSANKATPTTTTTRSKAMVPEVTPAAKTDQTQVTDISKQYMNALLQQHYAVMWSMLHPQVQAMWPNENAYVTYWKSRFHGYTLQGFSVGNVSQLSFWTTPETMVQYHNVYSLPISLQIQSQFPAAQLVKLAPQFQHPSQLFQHLPLIVQNSN